MVFYWDPKFPCSLLPDHTSWQLAGWPSPHYGLTEHLHIRELHSLPKCMCDPATRQALCKVFKVSTMACFPPLPENPAVQYSNGFTLSFGTGKGSILQTPWKLMGRKEKKAEPLPFSSPIPSFIMWEQMMHQCLCVNKQGGPWVVMDSCTSISLVVCFPSSERRYSSQVVETGLAFGSWYTCDLQVKSNSFFPQGFLRLMLTAPLIPKSAKSIISYANK